ncbi:MAG: S9 family peptidase [Xanthomonadales bacterium]|nr:prolyl oligopeptidase family serine peptidase [Gammaproteobacteria bacterium]MBT8054020.1 prolyl oligopeptidase family serine peptidase [Gammaproteobacteria bacterium]NND56970.1 S9 family peptidase [Xanthomonadales bacterium]NNK51928.1 S9 family peptidase [Xanthomonadales bacterium]
MEAEVMEDAGAMTPDPYLWLEDVLGEKALEWVRAENDRTLGVLASDPRFEMVENRALGIYNATDKIVYAERSGDEMHNFWRDETNVRGVWRKTSVEAYASGSPLWETVLDVDALAEAEGRNWVYKGRDCLMSAGRCMVRLSDGGTDSVVLREFDVSNRRFVEGGFESPNAKQWVNWLDADTLMIATGFGPDTINTSGYPRQVRLWDRGTPLADARLIFEGPETDAFEFPLVSHRDDGTHALVLQGPDFFTQTLRLLNTDGTLTVLPLPRDVSLQGFMGDHLIASLRSDWMPGDSNFPAGSVVSVLLQDLVAGTPEASLKNVYAPDAVSSVESVTVSRDRIYIALLSNVTGKLLAASSTDTGWALTEITMPENGSLNVRASDDTANDVFVSFESYLQPESLYRVMEDGEVLLVQALPERFDADGFVTEQKFAVSTDRTKIPYFLVRAKDLEFDGQRPTLLYAYGGFEQSSTPGYTFPIGNSPNMTSWLEAGGTLVVANIRGGGEFGPKWHQAALKENRQVAFDDMIAVAEDLVETGLTNPRRLGAMGRSNGGLLMGAMLTQRPELFNAIVIGVPLLDMLRYHKLLAGASWIAEYGNPDLPEEAGFISDWSPYQKMGEKGAYPEVLFYSSTRDDRVHPGHGRKMAARMRELGHSFLYYENIEGGHAGSSDLKQRAFMDSLQIVYLMQKLMD